jgi:ribonuclease BN (tRNA processing enzyme)
VRRLDPVIEAIDAEAIDAERLAARMPQRWRRVLLFGDRGAGTSALVRDIAQRLGERGVTVSAISADPGSPAFGLPGMVTLAKWDRRAWRIEAMEPLCTLDAGRFRLPLVQAVTRLARAMATHCLLVNAPGVVHGVAGSEMLEGLVGAVGPDAVAVLAESGDELPLAAQLGALGAALCRVPAVAGTARPDALTRARSRTRPWDDHLAGAVIVQLPLASLRLLGTPPPETAPQAWSGRQVAVYANGSVVALGEVVRLYRGRLELRLDRRVSTADALVVRDAHRRADGLLVTAATTAPAHAAKVVGDARSSRRAFGFDAGPLAVTLVNGVFGDPLALLRLRGARRVILLDLGEAATLSRRVMHQVTDVFVSHAHFDHVAGFMWLLRARMGTVVPPCRIYGPPGMHAHIAGMVAGVRWDRIGDAGPEFVVGEVRSDRIDWVRIKAGAEAKPGGAESISRGVLRSDAAVCISAIELDHGIPVLSFAVECGGEKRIRKDRLDATGLPRGPWLRELKRLLLRGDTDAVIELPDGRTANAAVLANDLVEGTPRVRLVYATDFADTSANRERLQAHAHGADVLICESPFIAADAVQAERTQHLTARACGEIAAAARVARLIPFHFSKRYDGAPEAVYAEIGAACADVPIHAYHD